MRLRSLLAPLAALLALSSARPAEACAPAPPEGAFVRIAEESAIIAWDEAAKKEHFIRRAAFRTTAKDFGFLVPTPSAPELAEVADQVFQRLEDAIRPELIHRTETSGIEPTISCLAFTLRGDSAPSAAVATAPVRVLDARRVAGYDAVVLEADSAGELAAWLKKHGYAERPTLVDWLAPYVSAHWKITAFKIASDQPAEAVSTAAVRMSFSADKPFYPYREPADQRETLPASVPLHERGRMLRVFFFGPERVDGAIGEAKATWPGKTIWSNRVDEKRIGELPFTLPAGAWMTAFEDASSPRPGTDELFFAPAADKSPLIPEPIAWVTYHKLPLPIDLLVLPVLAGFLIVRWRRRAAAPSVAA